MNASWQPILSDEKVMLEPLKESDFEQLYAIANDPLIWEQHPNPDRWKYDDFKIFFNGALLSGGALKILDYKSKALAGCTRFYDFNEASKSIFIGYTFLARKWWGQGYNISVKKLMLDYAFQYVSEVYFHIGEHNLRSISSIKKLNVKMTRSIDVCYFGELPKTNNEYMLEREAWNFQN